MSASATRTPSRHWGRRRLDRALVFCKYRVMTQIFITLPVADLDRSRAYYAAIGLTLTPR